MDTPVSGCGGTGPESLDQSSDGCNQTRPFLESFRGTSRDPRHHTVLQRITVRIQNQMKFSCGRKPRRDSCSQCSREVLSWVANGKRYSSSRTEVARHLHGSTAVTVRSHPHLYVGHIGLFCDYLLGYSVPTWGSLRVHQLKCRHCDAHSSSR
jgi:hypothetical protein